MPPFSVNPLMLPPAVSSPLGVADAKPIDLRIPSKRTSETAEQTLPNLTPFGSRRNVDDPLEVFMRVDESQNVKWRALMTQYREDASDPNVCGVCGKRLSCKSALTMHYRVHTGEEQWKKPPARNDDNAIQNSKFKSENCVLKFEFRILSFRFQHFISNNLLILVLKFFSL